MTNVKLAGKCAHLELSPQKMALVGWIPQPKHRVAAVRPSVQLCLDKKEFYVCLQPSDNKFLLVSEGKILLRQVLTVENLAPILSFNGATVQRRQTRKVAKHTRLIVGARAHHIPTKVECF